MKIFNKKIKKKQERLKKIEQMNQSAIKKMGEEEGMKEDDMKNIDPSSMNLMAGATI